MLKTDYRDDMFAGARKYAMTTNDDKTISLIDMTEYTQEGDFFGANDINASNTEINRLGNAVVVSLPASGWSGSFHTDRPWRYRGQRLRMWSGFTHIRQGTPCGYSEAV